MQSNNKSSRFKAIAAQTTAVLVKNLLPLNVGLCLTFPDILIAALAGLNSEINPNETIKITAEQASWLGSIGFGAQVIGSILSGFIAEAFGRKTALCLVNIPLLIGWLLFYSATSLAQIYIAALLFGVGIGLTNSPSAVYVGEISENSVRDILTSLTGVLTTSGIFAIYLLGNLANWQNIALYCSIVPIVAIIAFLFIPETPTWLLLKNRDEEALKSLCWLRGWTSKEAVRDEFETLKAYRESTNKCSQCQRDQIICTHPLPTLMDKFNAMFKSSCMRPILIFTICSLFTNFSGLHHVFPFSVQILNTFNCPFNPNKAIILFGASSFTITVIFSMIIKFIGKRNIYFISLVGMAACNLALGIYAILYLPFGVRTFDYENASTPTDVTFSYFPLVIMVISRMFTTGLIEVPFMLCSEIFPSKSRCLAAGICSAIFNLVLFITTKTFYDMEKWFSISITFCIYGVAALIGIIALYRIIPHTENVSLADIERHFTNKQHKWTDWKIAKANDTK